MEHDAPSLQRPLALAIDSAEIAETNKQHRPFQNPCATVLVTTNRGRESSTLNEGIVRAAVIVLIQYYLDIFDHVDPEFSHGGGCGDVTLDECCVVRRAALTLDDFVHQCFAFF